jgi:hypothetical protein
MPSLTAVKLVKSLLQEGDKGCLMFPLPFPEAVKVVEWSEEHIPDDQLSEEGREHEIHATCLYGFSPILRPRDVAMLVQSFALQTKREKLAIKLGKIGRFKHPEQDVLKVEVDTHEASDLADLHFYLRELLEPRGLVEVDYPEFNAHITLAYVKPGALPELDGHGEFEGNVYTTDLLVYSAPDSKFKCGITLDGGLVEESLIKTFTQELLVG